MAYPNYGYPQYQQPMYPVQQQIPQQQMPLQPMPQQMQSGGFMAVRTEQDARNYPVAPGNVMTFKIENQPYVCEKSQGFSQLEGPVFTKYRLVREDEAIESENSEPISENTILRDLEQLKEEVRMLKERVYAKPKGLNRDSHQNIKNKGGHVDE